MAQAPQSPFKSRLFKAASTNYTEGKALLDLVDRLPVDGDDLKHRRHYLQQALVTFLNGVTSDSDETKCKEEHILDGLSHQLRNLCFEIAHQTTHRTYKSPVQPHQMVLASGNSLSFHYERDLNPAFLEQRLVQEEIKSDDWQGKHLLFASGMTSLLMAVKGCLHFLQPSHRPLKLGMWGGYFETHQLLDLLSNESLEWVEFRQQAALWQALEQGEIDILLIEPVSYTWNLEILDLETLVNSWHSSGTQRPQALIVDASLVHPAFDLHPLLDAIADCPPTIVMQCRSGNKFDQQGLELSNVGMLSVYTPQRPAEIDPAETTSPTAQEVYDVLFRCRRLMGLSLSLEESGRLDMPFFLDAALTRAHAKTVFTNNADLARVTQKVVDQTPDSIFQEVIHPALSEQNQCPWACAPFVVFHLTEGTHDHYVLLLSIVEFERQRQRLLLLPGGSFGFRHHRFEVVWPQGGDYVGVFKVAMGIRRGFSKDGAISLLNHLARFTSYQALADAYPEAAEFARKYLRLQLFRPA